jgi:hypothetical protein
MGTGDTWVGEDGIEYIVFAVEVVNNALIVHSVEKSLLS